ncbi:MAG: FIST N-terminal domain-containing protein [Planctomycetota bacterium]
MIEDFPRFGWGLSAKSDPWDAADAATEQALARLGDGGVDFAFIVVCGRHGGHTAGVGDVVQRRAAPAHVIGCTASGCLAGAREVEDASAVSVMLARLPGVTLKPIMSRDWPARVDEQATDAEWLEAIGAGASAPGPHRGTMILTDPSSLPVSKIFDRLAIAAGGASSPVGPVFGGVSSLGSDPGGNRLLLNGTLFDDGGVGLAWYGDIAIDSIVSQGCTPVGPTWLVTKSRGNVIFELGGRPAVERMREVVEGMGEERAARIGRGLLLGRAVSEYKSRFGRGDFLIRRIFGADEEHGCIALGDTIAAGKTVQFHVRERATAEEDLALLLDGQKLHGTPAGALVFSCIARGHRLFSNFGHDARAIQRAFRSVEPGAERAKSGVARGDDIDPPVPLTGMFAAGEFGPIGSVPFVHGHTCSLALFRKPEASDVALDSDSALGSSDTGI